MSTVFQDAVLTSGISREVELGLKHKQRLLSGLSVLRLLDVGCSNGAISLLYARFCGAAKVYGVDVNPRLVSEAEKRMLMRFLVT